MWIILLLGGIACSIFTATGCNIHPGMTITCYVLAGMLFTVDLALYVYKHIKIKQIKRDFFGDMEDR